MTFVSTRAIALAALGCAMLAVWLALDGRSDAARSPAVAAAQKKKKAKRMPSKPSTKPRPYGILRLNRRGRYPAKVIPRVSRARRADRLGTAELKDLTLQCRSDTIDLGTWCLMSAPYSPNDDEAGKTDYIFAMRKCVELGGFLPTAGQLAGAAGEVKLSSTIDDARLTASIDEDRSDGLKDRVEISSTLITTTAGGSAAGSAGVTPGSRGNPKTNEPDPIPRPADPTPETLQYVTVYDRRNLGGFGGGRPVTEPGTFRCGFFKVQGEKAADVDR